MTEWWLWLGQDGLAIYVYLMQVYRKECVRNGVVMRHYEAKGWERSVGVEGVR